MQPGLVERAQRGDQDAFARLATDSVDRCYAIAYRILRDMHLAQDATQQALLGAWRDLPSLRDPVQVRCLAVPARRARRRMRRRPASAGSGAHVEFIPSYDGGTPDTTASFADRDELERGFRRLTPEARAVLVLHHYLGYQLTEIAATLDIPVGTARSRLHYATRQLRAAIEADARPTTPKERMA